MTASEFVAGEQTDALARVLPTRPRPRLRLPAPLEALNDGPHDPDNDTWIGRPPEPEWTERRARQQLRPGRDPRANVTYLAPRSLPEPVLPSPFAVLIDLLLEPIRRVLRFVGRISTTGEVVERPPPPG